MRIHRIPHTTVAVAYILLLDITLAVAYILLVITVAVAYILQWSVIAVAVACILCC
jgi:hypothetical protein